jgi:GT2 family glycosyltransferase
MAPPPSQPRALVSILVWDSHVYTKNLLANLDFAVPGTSFAVYFLDQGSGDETKGLLRDFVPNRSRMNAILLPQNIGYSAGHNFNYAQALKNGVQFDYFITVNSDVAFGEPGWVDMLVAAMDANPKAAIGGPFGCKQTPTHIEHCSVARMRAGDFSFVSGAVSIIRAETVRQIGLFDEIYTPAYFEDQDMVMRYLHYGWSQIHIDVPVVHGYLGEAVKVNKEKRAELLAVHGDFGKRNLETYLRRWNSPNALIKTSQPLDWENRLYIPAA